MHAVSEFEPRTHARATDPETSHAAATSVAEFAGSHCDRIIACLKLYGPLTKDEIATRTGLTSVQVDRRLPDLERQGLAEPTGGTRPSHAGRAERIWRSV
jgi:predicted ArsR family transcriptional regulator